MECPEVLAPGTMATSCTPPAYRHSDRSDRSGAGPLRPVGVSFVCCRRVRWSRLTDHRTFGNGSAAPGLPEMEGRCAQGLRVEDSLGGFIALTPRAATLPRVAETTDARQGTSRERQCQGERKRHDVKTIDFA